MTDNKPLLQYKRIFDESKGKDEEIKVTTKQIEKDDKGNQTMISSDKSKKVRTMQARTEDRAEELIFTAFTYLKKTKDLGIPEKRTHRQVLFRS